MAKSPNARGSMKNIDMAKRLLTAAKEDLKNDPEVRDVSAHNMIDRIVRDLESIEALLERIGY